MALDTDVQEAPNANELDEGMEEFDPASLPLGTFAAFPVSDEPEWLPFEAPKDGAELPGDMLTEEQTNAVDQMVKKVSQCEPTARRLEVQAAWRNELLDRGFHTLKPAENYGWTLSGSESNNKYGPYGHGMVNGYYPTNVIGPVNDILVAALTREIPGTQFFPSKPGDDGSITAAAAANKLKHFIANDNDYQQRISEAARYFMTDERTVWWMAPWADAQQWGYEDDTPAEVPETEGDGEVPETEGDGESAAQPTAKRPRIRSKLNIYGKLHHKCPIMMDTQRKMPWQQIADEWDIAISKAMLPWIASKITGGGPGVAEIQLDRTARCMVKLALQRTTGDSITRDVTMLFTWMRPEMYMDDSCPKKLRPWFWKTFPKGFLACHAGNQLGFVRNESMDEVLEVIHARSGQGQNRRSTTEAYVYPQLRLNNWVDLIDEFFRKTVPRVGVDADVWDVDKLRSSSVRVGAFEPALQRPESGTLEGSIVPFPMPTHQQALPDFIEYFATSLAEFLTGAMPSLSASQDDDPETARQSELQNGNAMGRLSENWKALEQGCTGATERGVRWAARVQPKESAFDSILPGVGRLSVKIADLQGGDVVAHPESSKNFPETEEQRELRWMAAINAAGSGNPVYQALMADPRNAALSKKYMPSGAVVANADAVEKQQGEFEVLLTGRPQPNPQKAALETGITKLTALINKAQMMQEQGGQVDPQQMQQWQAMLQQAQQALGTLPDLVSSVPVRGDGSENDAVEALVCLGMMNSPEGRRLANSKNEADKLAFQNLTLHWQQHEASAKKQQGQNQPPLVPKVSATVQVDKLSPAVQAVVLQEMGLPVTQAQTQQPLEPHEVTRETEGLNAAGAKTKETVSMSGHTLS